MDDDDTPPPIDSRAFSVETQDFTPADYECICRAYLGPAAAAGWITRKSTASPRN